MKEISFRNDVLPLKNKLFRLALRITLNREEAEDVVQDTLMKVWNSRDKWQQLESIEAYSLTIARNLSLDRIRIIKVDVDKYGVTANQYRIQSVPTLMLFRNKSSPFNIAFV